MRQRAAYAHAPFDSALYRRLLRQVRDAKTVETPPFASKGSDDAGRARLYLRHDIDTRDCVSRLPSLLDINLDEGISASVFVRTDGEDYAPRELAPVVERYRKSGVDFGLHTSCYVQERYFDAFVEDTNHFAEAFGFAPRSFTVHGLGDFCFENRMKFVEEVLPRLGELGYTFTDCHTQMRSYSYVITDCHPEPGGTRRFMYDDFLRLPEFLAPRQDYLVLTHPCYWK